MADSEDQPQAESIHSVYTSEEDKETATAIAGVQRVSFSAIIRSIIDDYLDGKLVVEKARVEKTSIWIDPLTWRKLRERTKADGVPIQRVLEVGIKRLRGSR